MYRDLVPSLSTIGYRYQGRDMDPEELEEKSYSLRAQAESIVKDYWKKSCYTDECRRVQWGGLQVCREITDNRRCLGCNGHFLRITGRNLLGISVPIGKPLKQKNLFDIGSPSKEARIEMCLAELIRRSDLVEDLTLPTPPRQCAACGIDIFAETVSSLNSDRVYCSFECREEFEEKEEVISCKICSNVIVTRDCLYKPDETSPVLDVCRDCFCKIALERGWHSRLALSDVMVRLLLVEGFEFLESRTDATDPKWKNRVTVRIQDGLELVKAVSKNKARQARRYLREITRKYLS
jgi:hypothetical protein